MVEGREAQEGRDRLPTPVFLGRASLVAQLVKNLPAM